MRHLIDNWRVLLTQKVSLARRFALVPLGPPLLAYCSNCKAMLTASDGAVELVVDRPYKAGESIVVWYKDLSCSAMTTCCYFSSFSIR